jgi:hypothetical protein
MSKQTPDDGQRNCPKQVVSCQNKFVKLVHLVGFIIKKDVSDSLPNNKALYPTRLEGSIQT